MKKWIIIICIIFAYSISLTAQTPDEIRKGINRLETNVYTAEEDAAAALNAIAQFTRNNKNWPPLESAPPKPPWHASVVATRRPDS